MDTQWETLLSTALLGTDQRPPVCEPDGPALLQQLDSGDPAHWLLLAGGVVATCRRAGFLPPQLEGEALPAPSLPEVWPICSSRAVAYLSHMLENPGMYHALLLELLRLLGQRRKRVPPALLPRLLDLARRHKEVAAAVTPVLGMRGRWLAEQNPDWQRLAETEAPDDARDTPATAQPLQATAPTPDHRQERSGFWAGLGRRLRGRDSDHESLLREVVDSLVDQNKAQQYLPQPAQLAALACRIPPDLLDEAIKRLQHRMGDGSSRLQTYQDLLVYRRQMLQELAHE